MWRTCEQRTAAMDYGSANGKGGQMGLSAQQTAIEIRI